MLTFLYARYFGFLFPKESTKLYVAFHSSVQIHQQSPIKSDLEMQTFDSPKLMASKIN